MGIVGRWSAPEDGARPAAALLFNLDSSPAAGATPGRRGSANGTSRACRRRRRGHRPPGLRRHRGWLRTRVGVPGPANLGTWAASRCPKCHQNVSFFCIDFY